MAYSRDSFDIVVIGGGHAGCEAALAAARMGQKTLLLAISLDSIAMMPCNPSIGGTSKGHLVREIDALGGEMAKNIDKSFLQTKMLNKSKGPAVYSLRAQADKAKYSIQMKRTLENCDNLFLVQGEVERLIIEDSTIKGVRISSGAEFEAKAVILAAGTYVKSRCLYGETIIESGPNGLKSAGKLGESLIEAGIRLMRFKTGTPARLDKRFIDFDKMTIQEGDLEIIPFSFETNPESVKREQIPCYMTYTNTNTHEIIMENIHRSPIYAGVIEGAPTRYCPSIEDKVVRFSDKDRHQIFIEPEGEDTNETYIQGMSSSLPEDVQLKVYRSIEGLEKCEMMRPAYAIEYDCIDATQLKLNLEFKKIKRLFSAGQFNGSSGYEEAAAQGLIAGINAVSVIKNMRPLILDRSEAYIGVLIDDLVTKGTKEPYRMMTSRAEYRLLLRQDNADIRLREIGYNYGLVSELIYKEFCSKKRFIDEEIKRIKSIVIPPSESVNNLLEGMGSARISTGVKLYDLLKRPELTYDNLKGIDINRNELPKDVTEQVNIIIKYEGYIKLQSEQAEKFKKIEKMRIPEDLDYNNIGGLSTECKQKLNALRPGNIGQASRITGVSPADISILMVRLKERTKNK